MSLRHPNKQMPLIARPADSSGRIAQAWGTALNRIVFCGLCALVVLVVIPYGTVDSWWDAAFECAVFALTALWLVQVMLRGDWELRRLLVVLPLALLTLFMYAQAFGWPPSWLTTSSRQTMLTIDRYQTLLTARKTLALTLFFGVLLLHTCSVTRVRYLVRVLIGAGLASATFGILRQLLQSPSETPPFILPFLFYGIGYAQFLSPNLFAFFMEMVLGLVAGLVLGGGVRRQLVLPYFAIAIVIGSGLILSNSRGAVFGLLCQAIFLTAVSLAWYSSRRLSREEGQQPAWLRFLNSWFARVLTVLVVVTVLVVGVFWMAGDRLAAKEAVETSTSDGTTRKEIWNSTWRLIRHNPVTGVGFGTYFLAIPQYQSGSGRLKVEQAHNDYLDLAANGGLIGVVLTLGFAGFVISRVRLSWRSSHPYRRAAALGAVAGIVSVGVHSFVDFGLQTTGMAVVFSALIVVAIATTESSLPATPK
jgi:O-antigen ligase